MMTLLFGFFVILYSFSNVDEGKFNSVSKKLAEAFKGDVKKAESKTEVGMLMQARQLRALQLLVAMLNLGENVESAVDKIERSVAESQSLAMAREALMEGLDSKEDSILSKLRVTMQDKEDRVELALPGGMLFRSGTADLTPEAKTGIRRIARYLVRIKGLVAVEVVGHTDSAPPPRGALYPSNWALSSARAGAVTEELVNQGIPSKIVAVRGMASLDPLFPERRANGSWIAENMARNRRVHIILKKSKNGT
jgi:chemotaxis protein MotB